MKCAAAAVFLSILLASPGRAALPADALRLALEKGPFFEVLALAEARDGTVTSAGAASAARRLREGEAPPAALAAGYETALGGLVGPCRETENGALREKSEVRGFYPAAAGYESLALGGGALRLRAGTPVVAAEAGTVEAAAETRLGRCLLLRCGPRLYLYNGLSAPVLAPGETAEAGAVLGLSGERLEFGLLRPGGRPGPVVDTTGLLTLLERHKSEVVLDSGVWRRVGGSENG